LKDKSEIEIPSRGSPNERKNERIGWALKKISKLKSWFNPNPTKLTKNNDSRRESMLEMAVIALNFIDVLKRP
jgi:hypothetical protein